MLSTFFFSQKVESVNMKEAIKIKICNKSENITKKKKSEKEATFCFVFHRTFILSSTTQLFVSFL